MLKRNQLTNTKKEYNLTASKDNLMRLKGQDAFALLFEAEAKP